MEFYPIKDYEGIYEINRNGDVNRILKSGPRKAVKKSMPSRGSEIVTLCKKNEKTKVISMRQLLFNTFAPTDILTNGKKYNIISSKKNNIKFEDIEWFQIKTPYLQIARDQLTPCELFAKDTKYVSYQVHESQQEYFTFTKNIYGEIYKERWNIFTIDENLDVLKFKYNRWLKSLPKD